MKRNESYKRKNKNWMKRKLDLSENNLILKTN